MNIALWIVAGVLAAAALAGGAQKLIQPKEKLAAVGLVLLMVGAMITHVRRHEAPYLVVNLVVLAVAAFVAWGRLGPQPFSG
ncbi:DoxX family protein [Kribbella sp. NBC_01245]|uniref:DoxX family protein n=1 Tax=Kribbella sp. NBC_01245 TaxID=2903578 RepID=UPI002E283B13|nr:DoxX family protein [Kribbella sp. NBC_01245]